MNAIVLKEVWKDINGFEGMYQISNLGRVKSLVRPYHPKEQILTNRVQCPGRKSRYKRVVVHLWKDGKTCPMKVHRLVAEAFIENPNGYTMINHIDSNPLNNDISNLEWSTSLHNNRHGMRFGKMSDRVKITDEKAVEISRLYEANVPIAEIGKRYGITPRNVYAYAKSKGVSKSMSEARKKYRIDPYELKLLLDMGHSQKEIAKAYGCSQTTIRNIWKQYMEGEGCR